MDSKEVQKRIHQTLDPIMKAEGFKRKGRTYYKQSGDIIFVLQINAVGAYFSSVTNWPSHSFSIWDGVWVDGITPGYINRYPKSRDKDGAYIPEAHTCFHLTGDDLKYGIHRKDLHPYADIAIQYGVNSEPEKNRRDIWVMPEERDLQEAFLQELEEQVCACFLNCYSEYTEPGKLQELILDNRRVFNQNRGYEEGQPFQSDSYAGNFQGYLQLSVLFHQKYGTEERYQYYLNRYEEWARVHKKKVQNCCYCGYGKEFKV